MSGIVVPALVRERAVRLGPPGVAWLAGLGELVADLERRWSIRVGPPLTGGSTSYVARARTAGGQDAVLRLQVPDPQLPLARQVRTLRTAQGDGYVIPLAHNVRRHALLLEALGAPLSQSGLPPEQQLRLLSTLLRQAWQVPHPVRVSHKEVQQKPEELAALVESLWRELERPCSPGVVSLALQYAQRRREHADPASTVVAHGDPHPNNALRVLTPRAGAESGYVLVDPEALIAEPAYDLGVVLRGWCDELLRGSATAARRTAESYCRILAESSGVDERAIWEWGFLERVSSGLYLLHLGAGDLGRKYLDTAERLVASEPV